MTERCPVCQGCGLVPPGFYDLTPLQVSTTAVRLREPCRACGGRGVIQETPLAETAAPPPVTIQWTVDGRSSLLASTNAAGQGWYPVKPASTAKGWGS